MQEKFYITTTLPYVNAEPHIGFASEIIMADARTRWERFLGKEVIFNTGVDEHGLKIWQKAREENKEVQNYVDQYATKFNNLKEILNLSYTNFTRTTDKLHEKAVQEIWKKVEANGYIYKKKYKVKYCVGCELEKTDSELEEGFCPLHPGKKLEVIEEENYFFRFSSFQKKLLNFYEKNPEFVRPEKRFNEIKSFVKQGLEDFSISRLKNKMPWGIAVPDDDTQVMYVWFDALTNYISTLGWPNEEEKFQKFWGTKDKPKAIQIAGKDNLRQQSAMWQAMLMAADLPTSQQVFINGFISVAGQKMSKSLGNVIAPQEMVDRFGVDGTRYLLLTKGALGEDSDISWKRLTEKYNADLANGLGNLVMRVVKLGENIQFDWCKLQYNITEITKKNFKEMDLDKELKNIMKQVGKANKLIEKTKPWELAKNNLSEFQKIMQKLFTELFIISKRLEPLMPGTAKKIKTILETKKRIILFARIK